MALSGPNAGTTTTSESFGGSSVAWVNPSNAQVDDGQYATADTTFSLDDITERLKMVAFGHSIPGGATIDGVIVNIRRKTNLNGLPLDSDIRLVIAGTPSGTNQSAGAGWSDTEGTVSFGGATNTWGLSLTPSDVNDANFGFILVAVDASTGGWIASVNFMELGVYYTEAGVSGVQTMALMGVGG